MSNLIIIGGYGHVGRRLATVLARSGTGGRTVLAGRRPEAAAHAAAELGVRAASHAIDLRTGDGLADVAEPADLVVNAAGDDRQAVLLRACLDLGLHYADLTADRAALSAMLQLDDDARARGTSALIGIGLAPGATNILAKAAADAAGHAERIDVGLLLSLADSFGPAALSWTLDTLTAPDVDAFARHLTMDIDTRGRRRVYSFGFPEQYFLPTTLGVPAAHSWFGVTPAPLGRLVAWLARGPRVAAALAKPSTKRRILRLAARLPEASPRAPVAATAVARRGEETFQATLLSRSESETTARCAAILLDCWDTSEPGVRLPESAIAPAAFFDRVPTAGMRLAGNAIGDANVQRPEPSAR